MDIAPSEILAIPGPDGAGKTTLVSLSPLFLSGLARRAVLLGGLPGAARRFDVEPTKVIWA